MSKQALAIGIIGLVIGLVAGNFAPSMFGGSDSMGASNSPAATNSSAAGGPGFIGLEVQAIDKRTSESLGTKTTDGVMIRDVAVGQPGALAGFKRGDLVVRFGGTNIRKLDDLLSAVSKTKAGQTIATEIVRAGRKSTLMLTTGLRPESWNVTKGAIQSYGSAGFTVAALNPQNRTKFSTRWGATGLIVTQVDQAKPAAQVLQRGDLIVQVNLRDIWKPEQLSEAIKKTRDENRRDILLLVDNARGYRHLLLTVNAGKNL